MKRHTCIFGILLFLCSVFTGLARDPSGLQQQDRYKGSFTIKENRFSIWNGKEYIPVFIKGINMGVAVPGTQPGQLAATREDYRRWFRLIKEAGYNTIRIYTLHYPRFYEELEQYNLAHPVSPLLLIQGIWLDENETAADLFAQTQAFSKEIEEVVRAVHGDVNIEPRLGKAYGFYASDVSRWVIGFLSGREIFPEEVAITNDLHPEINEYAGTFFHLEGGGDPIEVWIAHRIDSLQIFEYEHYGKVRPAGFTSWPTLDPILHPTEQAVTDSQEDDEQIDLSNLVPNDSSGGFFIGYHAYPYYPDFIVQDPSYRIESDSAGPNSYLGYLRDLKRHYHSTPLLIAEFGVPTSWGSGHLSPTGMHHGGVTEEEQGRYAIRMLDNIREAGCAGGIQFSLIDEWFKQTWITNPLSDKAFRHYWHNITSPEQNFGILSYDPPPIPFQESGSYSGRPVNRIRLASDYTYFRVRIYLDSERFPDDTLWIAFDTYEKGLGESILPNGVSIGSAPDTLRAEFALSVPLRGNRADLYVIPSYDVFGIKNPIRVDTVVSEKSDKGTWNLVRWKTNYAYNITQYIGKLRISSPGDPYHFLNAVTVFSDSLEVRIPWTLLNFPAPSVRRAMHYLSHWDGGEIVVEQQDTLSDGIAVTVSHGNNVYQSVRYTWNPWDHEKIANESPLERKKESFHYLKRWLPEFNSPPIGIVDTFEVEHENFLEVTWEEGVLANDLDIDNNGLSAMLSFGSGTSSGSLFLHPDGSFNYLPESGFMGEDYFMYYIDDGYTYSALVPVVLKVGFPLQVSATSSGKVTKMFPNPVSGRIYIQMTDPFQSACLRILDLTGRQILYQELQYSEGWVDMQGLSPGVYMFNMEVDQKIETHRIIVR
jgi:hypothetical protein